MTSNQLINQTVRLAWFDRTPAIEEERKKKLALLYFKSCRAKSKDCTLKGDQQLLAWVRISVIAFLFFGQTKTFTGLQLQHSCYPLLSILQLVFRHKMHSMKHSKKDHKCWTINLRIHRVGSILSR